MTEDLLATFEKSQDIRPAIDVLHELSADVVGNFKAIAQKHGVSVTDVAKAGEQYTSYDEKRRPLKATVQPGKAMVKITSQKFNLTDFWKEINSQP